MKGIDLLCKKADKEIRAKRRYLWLLTHLAAFNYSKVKLQLKV